MPRRLVFSSYAPWPDGAGRLRPGEALELDRSARLATLAVFHFLGVPSPSPRR